MDTLFHEGSKRRNTRARTDHDDVRVLIFWENERLCWRHEHANGCPGRVDFIGHELRAQPTTGTSVVFEADDADGQFDETWVGIVRGRNGVEARLETVGQFKEFFWRVLHIKFAHDVNVISSPEVILDGLGVGRDGFNLSCGVIGGNGGAK